MASKWISLAEASRILGIAPNTIRRLVERGTLPAFKIQGVAGYRFQREQVEALIQPVVVGTEKKQKHREKVGQSPSRSRSKRASQSWEKVGMRLVLRHRMQTPSRFLIQLRYGMALHNSQSSPKRALRQFP